MFLFFILPIYIKPHNYPSDDAYFYLQIASNIYNGHGSTFNMISQTNGYHPLWMLFCVLGFIFSGGSKPQAIFIIFLFQQIFTLGLVYLLYKTFKLLKIKFWYISLPIIFTFFLTRLYGSEANLNGLMIILTLYFSIYYLMKDNTNSKFLILVGLSAGITFLARLDNIFFILILFLFLLLKQKDDKLKCILYISTPFIITTLPYLIYNIVYFEHSIPISGAIKSTFPNLIFNTDSLSFLGKILLCFSIINFLICIKIKLDEYKKFAVYTLSAGVILQSIYLVLFTNGTTFWSWYYVLGIINLSMSLSIYIDQAYNFLKLKNPKVYRMVFNNLVLIFSVGLTFFGVSRVWIMFYYPDGGGAEPNIFSLLNQKIEYRWQIEFSNWLKKNFLEQRGIFFYDFPGIISYMSEQRILSADGLTSDYLYNDKLLSNGILSYLKDKNINYWFGPVVNDTLARTNIYKIIREENTQSIEIFSPLKKQSAGKFLIYDSDKILNLKDISNHPDCKNLALWKLRIFE